MPSAICPHGAPPGQEVVELPCNEEYWELITRTRQDVGEGQVLFPQIEKLFDPTRADGAGKAADHPWIGSKRRVAFGNEIAEVVKALTARFVVVEFILLIPGNDLPLGEAALDHALSRREGECFDYVNAFEHLLLPWRQFRAPGCQPMGFFYPAGFVGTHFVTRFSRIGRPTVRPGAR